MSALFVSKFTFWSRIMPVSSSSASRSVTSIGQPCASTLSPAGVSGHWSRPSNTPSPSLSLGQPFSSTLSPAGVSGHWSRPSNTPSPSLSLGQPFSSIVAPFGVPGHWSRPSSTPSPSESLGQPFASTVAPFGVPGHWSRPSNTPSPSESSGQPLASTLAPLGVFGHLSFLSGTPSPSVSRALPPSANVSPAPRIIVFRWSAAAVGESALNDTSRASNRSPRLSVSQSRSPPPNSSVPVSVFGPAAGFPRVQPPPANTNGPPQRPRAGDSTRLPLACIQSKSRPFGASSAVEENPLAASMPTHDVDCHASRPPTCRSSVTGRLLPGNRILPSNIVYPPNGVNSQCVPRGSATATPAASSTASASGTNLRRCGIASLLARGLVARSCAVDAPRAQARRAGAYAGRGVRCKGSGARAHFQSFSHQAAGRVGGGRPPGPQPCRRDTHATAIALDAPAGERGECHGLLFAAGGQGLAIGVRGLALRFAGPLVAHDDAALKVRAIGRDLEHEVLGERSAIVARVEPGHEHARVRFVEPPHAERLLLLPREWRRRARIAPGHVPRVLGVHDAHAVLLHELVERGAPHVREIPLHELGHLHRLGELDAPVVHRLDPALAGDRVDEQLLGAVRVRHPEADGQHEARRVVRDLERTELRGCGSVLCAELRIAPAQIHLGDEELHALLEIALDHVRGLHRHAVAVRAEPREQRAAVVRGQDQDLVLVDLVAGFDPDGRHGRVEAPGHQHRHPLPAAATKVRTHLRHGSRTGIRVVVLDQARRRVGVEARDERRVADVDLPALGRVLRPG